MSGGSYSYVSSATDLTDLIERRCEWQRLVGDLPADDAGAAAEALLALIDALDGVIRHALVDEGLGDVLHAYEWWQSNDYGPPQFAEAVHDWRVKTGRPTACDLTVDPPVHAGPEEDRYSIRRDARGLDRYSYACLSCGRPMREVVVPCCEWHRGGPTQGGCCDPEDCAPCCPRCPTCPALQRQRATR